MTPLRRPAWPRRSSPDLATARTVRPRLSRSAWRTPGGALFLVVVALLVGLGLAAQIEPAQSGTPTALSPKQRFVPVARASAVCPDAVADATTGTTVTLAAPGAIDVQTPDAR